MPFYKWETIEQFNAWHETVKTALGLPYDDGVTTEYTSSILQADGTVIAYSDDEYSENLIAVEYITPTLEYGRVDEADTL